MIFWISTIIIYNKAIIGIEYNFIFINFISFGLDNVIEIIFLLFGLFSFGSHSQSYERILIKYWLIWLLSF
jgi:hypothetical protein